MIYTIYFDNLMIDGNGRFYLFSDVCVRFSGVEPFEFFPRTAPPSTKSTKAITITIRQPQQPLRVTIKRPSAPKLSRIKHSNMVIWCPQCGQRNELGANVLTMKNFLHFVQ